MDIAQIIAGPTVTMYLGDYGADVIKVEPLRGDASRWMEASDLPAGFGREFLAHNRNKRSIAIDFSSELGQEVLGKLIQEADVLVTNLVDEVAGRLGLDYHRVRGINPRIIYARVTAYRGEGSLGNRVGFDLTFQARAGTVAARRMPDGTPVVPSIYITDYPGAMMLCFGITLALLDRERSGEGQKVEISLIGMALHMQAADQVRIRGACPQALQNLAAANVYCCADGKWLMLVILTDPQWQRLCRTLGLDHLAADPRFGTFRARTQNAGILVGFLAGVFATRARDDWLAVLDAEALPAGPVLDREEVFGDPLVQESRVFTDLDYEGIGNVSTVGLPVSLSRTPGQISRPAPQLGQHTRDVLRELGYGAVEVQDLLRNGAVATTGDD